MTKWELTKWEKRSDTNLSKGSRPTHNHICTGIHPIYQITPKQNISSKQAFANHTITRKGLSLPPDLLTLRASATQQKSSMSTVLIEATFLHLSRAEGRLEFVLRTLRIGFLIQLPYYHQPSLLRKPSPPPSKSLLCHRWVSSPFCRSHEMTIMPGDCFMSSHIHSKQHWMDHWVVHQQSWRSSCVRHCSLRHHQQKINAIKSSSNTTDALFALLLTQWSHLLGLVRLLHIATITKQKYRMFEWHQLEVCVWNNSNRSTQTGDNWDPMHSRDDWASSSIWKTSQSSEE